MTDERMGLAGTLALLAATVAVLFAVALGVDDDRVPSVAAGTSEEPAPDEPAAKLDSGELLDLSLERSPIVARRVAEIRGVEFDRVP